MRSTKTFTMIVSQNDNMTPIMDAIHKKMKDGIIWRYDVRAMTHNIFSKEGVEVHAYEVSVEYYDTHSLNIMLASAILFDGDEEMAKRYVVR